MVLFKGGRVPAQVPGLVAAGKSRGPHPQCANRAMKKGHPGVGMAFTGRRICSRQPSRLIRRRLKSLRTAEFFSLLQGICLSLLGHLETLHIHVVPGWAAFVKST